MIITSSIKFPGDNVWFKKSEKFEVAFLNLFLIIDFALQKLMLSFWTERQ